MRKILFVLIFLFFWPAAGEPLPASDFYKILGVSPRASSDEMAQAYRRVKKKLRSGSLESAKRLKELEEAHRALQDPRRRAEYDSRLKKSSFQKEPNFYKLLGVLSNSPAVEITRAYKQIRQRIHPDKNEGDPEATRRFQELQQAHKALSDPRLRLRHDLSLRHSEGHFLESSKTESGASAEKPQKAAAAAGGKGAAAKTRKNQFYKTAAGLEEEASLNDVLLWNEEIFRLAKELESTGGEKNIQEAAFWYRQLAVEGHVEAARRLAPLLEGIDWEEALYRYRQGMMDDSDRGFSRAAAFRQAQIYLNGVYEGYKAIIPKDLEKAAELFEQAFELGAAREAIAKEYDIIRSYETALAWRRGQKGGGQASQARPLEGGKKIRQSGGPAQQQAGSPIHFAVFMKKDKTYPHQDSVIRMLTELKRSRGAEIDWNAYNSGGRTALSLAVEFGQDDVVRFLIQEGADQTVPDADGFLPIHQMFLKRREHPFRLISSFHPFQPTWTRRAGSGGHGKTPLEMALEHKNLQNNSIARGDELLMFAYDVIRKEGVSYLSDEEFDRILRRELESGREKTASLLMSKRSGREASAGGTDLTSWGWGNYGAMAGAAGAGIFAVAEGSGFLGLLGAAGAGAIALGLPLVLLDSCRHAFREGSREGSRGGAKRDSKNQEKIRL